MRVHSQSSSGVLAREAQVTKLDTHLAIKKHVLKLEVAVHNALVVQVPDGGAQLAEEAPRLSLEDAPSLDKIVEQLTARAQLRHEPYVRLGRDDLV
jgi:hypothetical protein